MVDMCTSSQIEDKSGMFDKQLKNEISAQEKRNSPVPSQHELVEAIERRKQICWKQGNSQDKRRDLLLMDEEFVKCSSILFQLSADACVTYQDNTLIYKCPGHDGSSSCPQNSTVIVRGQSGQSTVCRKYQQKNQDRRKSEKNRLMNDDK